MLDMSTLIRTEKELVQHKTKGPYRRTIWVFPCNSCGKEMRKQKSALTTHKGKCNSCTKRLNHPYQSTYNGMLRSIKSTNKRFNRELPVELTFEDFLEYTELKTCHYCSGEVVWREYRPGPYNLDRKDNNLGYHKGNLVVCCFECNHKKNRFYSYDEFVLISELLKVSKSMTDAEKTELKLSLMSLREQPI